MDLHQVKVLYSVFDLYKYSIYQEPELFEKSLKYRSSMDEFTFDCLMEYKEVQHVLNYGHDWNNYAIEDMLEQMSPSVLTRILLNVFSGQKNKQGETFLHVLARLLKPYYVASIFAVLFPHCTALHNVRDNRGLTPMAVVFFDTLNGWPDSLNFLYELVSASPDYFASLI